MRAPARRHTGRIASRRVSGWQHGTHDYVPVRDGGEEGWARALAAQGWRTWHRTGVWVVVGSTQVRRWAMRRPCDRPFSVHDHESACPGVTDRPN